MNILYIDHYAGSNSLGMEFRPFYLAKEWKKQNINTYILAADYSHLRKVNPTVSKDLEIQNIDGVDFIFLKTIKYDGNGVKRTLSMFEFLLKGKHYAKKISEIVKPDVVICSSTYPLDTYIGQKIAKLTNAKVIHEIHDLWPLSPMELGNMSKNHPFIKVMQIAENSAYKNSDVVVSILPNTEPYIRSLGFKVPVINIPNGLLNETIEEHFPGNENVINLIENFKKDGKFIVGYSGGISVSNAMQDFMDAMKILKEEENIAAVIIGDGILKENLIKFKEENDLINVHFVGSIKKSEVKETLSHMDALYIGSQKSKLYEYGVSANKIFDYMLVGLPIINAFDTKHSPMNYLGNTIECKANDSKEIANGIIKASKLTREEREKIKIDSIQYIKDNHNYNNLAYKFSELFSEEK